MFAHVRVHGTACVCVCVCVYNGRSADAIWPWVRHWLIPQ